MDTYAKTKLNKVRKSDRASYDKETVHAILDEGLLAHVGFVDNEWPMVIPMIYARIDDTLYLHGAKAARFAKVLNKRLPVSSPYRLNTPSPRPAPAGQTMTMRIMRCPSGPA